MSDKSLLNIGLAGSAIAALCCFTPILVVALSVVGLSSLVGALDDVLPPVLILFLLMTGYALWKRRRQT